MLQQDWAMRQIKMMVDVIAKLVLRKDTLVLEDQHDLQQEEALVLHRELLRMIEGGQINEAEDLLFDQFQPADDEFLRVAMDFYSRVNALTDKELEEADFTRDEIEAGIKSITKLYGLDIFREKYES